jgi:hypothetical protein
MHALLCSEDEWTTCACPSLPAGYAICGMLGGHVLGGSLVRIIMLLQTVGISHCFCAVQVISGCFGLLSACLYHTWSATCATLPTQTPHTAAVLPTQTNAAAGSQAGCSAVWRCALRCLQLLFLYCHRTCTASPLRQLCTAHHVTHHAMHHITWDTMCHNACDI